MTGYGKGNLVLHGKDITVEVKSVNHRYFEYSSRMSRFFSFLDDKIKKEIQGMIARGKVEVSLMIRAVENSETKIEPDLLLAKSYYDALNTISESLGLPNNADVLAISRFDGVLTQVKNEEDAETLWNDVKTVLHLAMEEFLAMRKAEGEKLLQKCSGVIVALDGGGKLLSSTEIADFMHKKEVQGEGTFSFVIGGSNGLSKEVLERANLILSFGKITFPHQLFRVILLEQIYRAFKINNNESYHK